MNGRDVSGDFCRLMSVKKRSEFFTHIYVMVMIMLPLEPLDE